MKTFISATVLFLSTFFNVSFALEPSDRSAIEDVIASYTKAWNQNEGNGFANDFTDEADFVNIFGMSFSGKGAIENRHIEILQTFLRGTALEVTDIQLREEVSGVVIAKVYWKLDGFEKQSPQTPDINSGIFTQVFVQKGLVWKISASQNTLITR